MNIRNVFLDMDGTLIDSLPGIQLSAEAAIQSVLPGRVLPDLRPLIGPPIREIFRRSFADLSARTIDELEFHFRKSYDTDGCLKGVVYEGVRDTLSFLSQKKVRLFLVTNKPTQAATRILSDFGLAIYFQGAIFPDSTPRPFLNKMEMTAHLLRQYELEPGQTILVGDSDDDSHAARACGLRFGAAAYGYGGVHLHPQVLKDFILLSFSDLLQIV